MLITRSILLVLCTLSFVLSGCSNLPVMGNSLPEDTAKAAALQKEAQSKKVSIDELIEAGSQAIAKGKEGELDFYAPIHLKKAEADLKKARKLKEKNKPESKAEMRVLAVGVPHLIEDGFANKKLVQEKLIKSFDHRAVLKSIDAHKTLPKAYNKVNDRLFGLIKRIEKGDLEKAVIAEAKLLKAMNKVEVDTIETQKLTVVKKTINLAKRGDSEDLAPATFTTAEAALIAAQEAIRQNPRDKARIDELSDTALKAAKHNLYVASEIRKILEISEKEMEGLILRIEGLLHNVSSAMNHEDLRYMSLQDQSNELAKAVRSLRESSGGVVSYAIPEPAESLAVVPVEKASEEPVTVSEEVAEEAVSDIEASLNDELAAEAAIAEESSVLDSEAVDVAESEAISEPQEAAVEEVSQDEAPQAEEAVEEGASTEPSASDAETTEVPAS